MNEVSETSRDFSRRAMAYLRLFRVSNVFTAMADVLMGFLVAHQVLTPWQPLVCLLFASVCIYTAGMVLNDVYDIEIDRVERPERPLPAGDIPWSWARRLGFLLLGIGALAALASGAWTLASVEGWLAWRGGLIALLLVVSVLLYDGVLKKTSVAPLVMGGCRFFNVLLGMSFAVSAAPATALLGYESHQWMIAGGFGCYIAGVTWFARTEAKVSSRWQLGLGVVTMTVGLLMLAWFPALVSENQKPTLLQLPENIVFLLFLLLGVSIVYRCTVAVFDPVPQRVQMAVKNCLQSLIVLSAAVTACVADFTYAVLVLVLLVPMFALGRWFRST